MNTLERFSEMFLKMTWFTPCVCVCVRWLHLVCGLIWRCSVSGWSHNDRLLGSERVSLSWTLQPSDRKWKTEEWRQIPISAALRITQLLSGRSVAHTDTHTHTRHSIRYEACSLGYHLTSVPEENTSAWALTLSTSTAQIPDQNITSVERASTGGMQEIYHWSDWKTDYYQCLYVCVMHDY